MTLINWEPYRDRLGLLTGKPFSTDPESNGVLFAAYERALRLRRGTWDQSSQDRLSRALAELSWDGRLHRPAPWTLDREAPDNHIGLGGCGVPCAAIDVLDYFEDNPEYLGYFRYLFPAIIAHLEWCAGRKPALWRRLYWTASFFVSGNATDQDPWLQMFLMIETARAGGGRLERIAEAVFWYRLRKNWPDGLAAIFAKYWAPGHPAALAAKDLGI